LNDVTETPMKSSFLPCSVYAFALSALIFSHLLSNAAIELFVAPPYTLGTHGEDWMNWHGVGCFFVGLVNLAALRWSEARPRRDIAFATAVIYGVWALQNLRLMFTPRFASLMWLHVLGCALAAVASLATARSLRAVAGGRAALT
jgi:hypothetical protein